MDWPTLIQTLANSVSAASVYALVAVGLSLAFGVMKMANFAHGEFFMVGAYVVYVLYALGGWPFPAAVLLAMPIVALLGLLTERLIFRPTRKNILAGFMATAGLTFMLQVIIGRIWGVGIAKSIPTPYMGAADIAGAYIGWQRLIVIPAAFAMLLALRFFLYRTRLGKALRACAQDPETAALQGVGINTMTALAMGLAGASAGLAGALMAPVHAVTPYMGHGVVLIAFVVVIVGGMASVEGAILAAVLLGFIHTFVTTLADSTVAIMVGVAFMALTLIVRPSGLLGHAVGEESGHGAAAEAPPERFPAAPKGNILPILGLVSLVGILFAVPFFIKPYYIELLIIFFINLILATSYRLVTTTGDWSLSHVVLMGAGGYAAALMGKLLGWPFWLTVPAAGVVAGLVGLTFIYPLLRTKGFGFFIASFALGELLRLVWVKVIDPFGGVRGIINIPSASIGPLKLGGSIPYFFVVLTVAAICLAVMYRLEKSRIGIAWKTIHTDEVLAKSVGIDVAHYRSLAFVIGSFFAGIAGALLAYRLGAIDPRNFDLITMVYLIIWVVVGGTATFWGPIIGLTVVTVAFEWTRPLLEWRPLIFGSILIFFLIFLPGGLEGLIPKFASAIRRPGFRLAQAKGWFTFGPSK